MPWPHALRSLRHRNLRLFFAGQSVSLVGTWMQSVAQGWLIYRLTRSSELLGLVAFLSQVPALLFSAWAGSLADRFPRRRVVLFTQINALAQAVLLAVVTLTGVVQPWHLLVLAWMIGLTYAFEIPARAALLGEIAGDDMPNALALNSTIFNATRMIGPAIAGSVVALIGEGWCFAINALTFSATIVALLKMDILPAPPREPGPSHLADGLAYARGTPAVRALLALVAASSFFALPYNMLLPVFASDVLDGGPRLLGALHACSGAGAFLGGVSLLRGKSAAALQRRVPLGASMLGGGLVVLALSTSPAISGAALVVVGFGFVSQMAGTMTLLQTMAPPELRGRMMGLYSMLLVGILPFGALAAGAAAHRIGAPSTLLVGSSIVLAAGVAFRMRADRQSAPVPPAAV